MKTLKMIQAIFLMSVLLILGGCSDQITSSGETGSSEKGEGVTASSSLQVGLPVVPTFRTQIRLKPHRSYTFDVVSTGFDRLYSIDIYNVSLISDDTQYNSDCKDISVYSLSNGSLLSCHSNGLEVTDITVENTGSAFLDLDVSLRGIKQKKGIKLDEK